jgi:hypothetical protein
LFLTLTALFFVAISVVVAEALRRGEEFACMCFGSGAQLSKATLIRAVALLGLSVAVAITAFQTRGSLTFTSTTAFAQTAAAALGVAASLSAANRIGRRIDPFDFDDRDSLVAPDWQPARAR